MIEDQPGPDTCAECGGTNGGHYSRCPHHPRHAAAAAKVTPIRPDLGEPEVTEQLANVPEMLRRLASEIELGVPVDLCLVVLSTLQTPGVPPYMVHSFGRRPGTFEAKGLLLAAAERVPVR